MWSHCGPEDTKRVFSIVIYSCLLLLEFVVYAFVCAFTCAYQTLKYWIIIVRKVTYSLLA